MSDRGSEGPRPDRDALERPRARSVMTPQEAALYDSIVVPRWSAHFARMLVAHVPERLRGQALDAGCRTGHPAYEVLRKIGPAGRVVAIDRDPVAIDIARRRALGEGGKRIFFKVESVEHLGFGDEVFELVFGNLTLPVVEDEARALSEMRRVLHAGGLLLLTRPLAGTFEEVLDMLREAAVRRDDAGLANRIDEIASRDPTPEAWQARLEAAGFTDVEVHVETLRLSFRSARELFADPMLRLVAMPDWRWIAGATGESSRGDGVMREVERALDVYFAGGPLSLSVPAGLATARRGQP